MFAGRMLPVVLCLSPCWGVGMAIAQAPSYTTDSIVNAASNEPGWIAPNSIATIYGRNLSYVTKAVSGAEISAGGLPTALGGVRVAVGLLRGHLLYVSPSQINFVVPAMLVPGDIAIRVDRDGVSGPGIGVRLLETAPAFFQLDAETAIAAHLDGGLVTRERPAEPGQFVVLYMTGLGRVDPEAVSGQLATAPAELRGRAAFRVALNGESAIVTYVGVSPGFSGLYQVNLRVPEAASGEQEIRADTGNRTTSPRLRLPVLRRSVD